MVSEGSIAPRERVNIVYRPATGDHAADVELPLKLLTLGDFTLRQEEEPIETLRAIEVDQDNFDAVMQAHALRLDLRIPRAPDASSEAGDTIDVQLHFNCLQDFSPDAIAAQVPQLRHLVEMREALKALKGPLGNIPKFRRRLQELIDNPALRDRLLAELGIASPRS